MTLTPTLTPNDGQAMADEVMRGVELFVVRFGWLTPLMADLVQNQNSKKSKKPRAGVPGVFVDGGNSDGGRGNAGW